MYGGQLMKLELWLDESGDFKSDHIKRLNPSLVGGVLLPKGTIDEETAYRMLGKSYVHFTDEPSDYTLSVLNDIQERNGTFVVFQNLERVMIIDGDTTYLNVLAEGIIQLLLRLSAAYGNFELSILVATRKNTSEGYGIISAEQYERRLRERVIVGLARKSLTNKSKWKWDITFDDARKSKRLMLADGVCNTYLTRTSKKFTEQDRSVIERIYKEEYIFSFFENSVEIEINKLLGEGNITDALFALYNSDVKNREYFLEIILQRLSQLDDHSRRTQLLGISTKLDTLIKIDRKYVYVKPVLTKMQEELFALLDKYNIPCPEFKLDVMLHLYAILTHEGSMAAEKQDKLVQEQLAHVEDIMVKLKYFNMFKLRQAIYDKNKLDVYNAIDHSSKGINVLKDTIEMIKLLDESGELEDTKYEYLGKYYGTRGQGYTMLIHTDPDYLPLAISDFNNAYSHFIHDKDKQRQHIYRAMAYCEAMKLDDALYFLFLSCELSYKTHCFQELLENLREQETRKVIFKYASYFRIMAYAKESGQNELADEMYQALHLAHITVDSLWKNYRFSHPMQYIFWFMGSYTARRGKQANGIKHLNEGIAICDELSFKHITLKLIQLGMLAEKALIKMDFKKDVIELYHQIENHCEVPSILKYIEPFKGVTANSITDEQLYKMVQVMRCIN
jgi:hypothetical protein